MNEPDIPWWHPDEYEKWARENKKRADRLLTAVKDILGRAPNDYNNPLWVEMRNAALDYEDKRG